MGKKTLTHPTTLQEPSHSPKELVQPWPLLTQALVPWLGGPGRPIFLLALSE